MIESVSRPCWCGAVDAQPLGSFELEGGDRFPLVKCSGCGVLALWPQPSDAQLIAAYSSEYYGSSRRKFVGPIAAMVGWFQGGRARMASRLLKGNIGGRVLDIGCGNGGFLLQMKQRGFQVEGTEWTAESAARVPVDAGIKVHVGDLLTLNLPAGSFDLVTLWHVFEHVRRPFELLQEVRRLLKPGGRLILSLPNAESRQARKFGLAWFHHDPPRHLFGFGPESLGSALKRAGFRIQRVSTFSLEQNPFGFIQSRLNRGSTVRDRLYTQLKGLSHDPAAAKRRELLWMLLLTPPAVIVSTVESMLGVGATMTVVAEMGNSADLGAVR